MEFDIEVENKEKDGIRIFYLEGKINFDKAPYIQDYIMDTINEENLTRVILNFENVNFIDSSGIGALLGIVTKTDANIRICNTDSTINNVLEIIGLLDMLKIDEDEKSSLDILRQEA